MRDFYFYIILFLFILNFVLLITLANFIIRLADNINKVLNLNFDKKQNKIQNKIQEDKGLIDI